MKEARSDCVGWRRGGDNRTTDESSTATPRRVGPVGVVPVWGLADGGSVLVLVVWRPCRRPARVGGADSIVYTVQYGLLEIGSRASPASISYIAQGIGPPPALISYVRKESQIFSSPPTAAKSVDSGADGSGQVTIR